MGIKCCARSQNAAFRRLDYPFQDEYKMIKCVAVYPHHMNSEYRNKIIETISLAAEYGFNEIFTTLHLPEYSLTEQLAAYEMIAEETRRHHMELTVDLGGPFIGKIFEDGKAIKVIKDRSPDFIRLDYGYDEKQVRRLYKEFNLQGFVINASIYDEKETEAIIDLFKRIDPNIKIRACHNYYIRNESGLDDIFAARQDAFFARYDIPVYYCVPSHTSPRGPLHEGLCTLEKHRHMSIRNVLTDLIMNHDLKAFMMADEWLTEDEFKQIETVFEQLEKNKGKNRIGITFYDNVSQEEKDIVLGKHLFRYDSPIANLRSQSSREMAEFAKDVKPNNMVIRKTGDVTIDNSLYKRYSGEMEVMLEDHDQDDRVNVVAHISDENDLYKLLYFRDGIEYIFEEQNDESNH